MRTIEELTRGPSAWPALRDWFHRAVRPIEVLSPVEENRADALLAIGAPTASPLGAVVYETGGIFVDHGWIRVLGSGQARMTRSLSAWNHTRSFKEPGERPSFLLVADDVVGGFFALDGGGIGPGKGELFYHAPDSLKWEPTGLDYDSFLGWCCDGNIEKFYEQYRWAGWERDVPAVGGDDAYRFDPLPFEPGPRVGERSRGVVPVADLYGLYVGSR